MKNLLPPILMFCVCFIFGFLISYRPNHKYKVEIIYNQQHGIDSTTTSIRLLNKNGTYRDSVLRTYYYKY